MSGLKESAKAEDDTSMSRISQDLLNNVTVSAEGATSGPSVHCPQETMELLSDQGDLLTSVGFMDSICSDGPAKAAYVNGSTSPHISDEILLDISKNVPGFLPKSLHTQNSVTTNVHFEGPDTLRKEGEITIRQTLTAEDVENRGIWGFDTESPESSLDNYDDGNDLSWNPQREFMKFLWDEDNGLDMEGTLSPVPSPINHKRRVQSPIGHKRRRRKEKLVLKIDPSEDIYSDLNFDSKTDHLGEGSRTEFSPVKKTRSPRKPSKLQSNIVKSTKYLNGAAEAVKHLFPKTTRKPISKKQKMGLIRETLSSDSCSIEGPTVFPHNSSFKEKSQEHRKMTCNTDTSSSKPFICKECGQCYHDRTSLLNHISVHQDKQQQIMEERNELHQIKDEGKDAKLQCPQCNFGTNCPNTFVQHAKTHEKDKRYYSCNKCDFVEMNEVELRRHLLHKHGVSGADHTVWKSDGFQERKVNKSISYSFERKNKNSGNHVEASYQPKFDEEQASQSFDSSNEEATPTEQPLTVCKVLTSCAKPTARSPKLSVKLRAPDKPDEILSSNGKCGLLRKKKVWTKKRVQSESRLDKSIHTLLSRKKRGDQSASESNTQRDPEGSSTTEFLNHSLNCETTFSGTGTSSPPSKCLKRSTHFKEGYSKRTSKSDVNVTCLDDVGNTNYTHLNLDKRTLKKSPSKRKMSTPFHNMQGQDILLDFPKCRQSFKKSVTTKRSKEFINNGDIMCVSNDDLGPEECEINENANARFIRKQSSHANASLGASTSHFERNHSSLRIFSVRDEYRDEEMISGTIADVKVEPSSDVETDLKACPYCPAVFESGISLSNHVRGHLHREGLKVRNSSKMASLHKVPQIRRRTLAQVKTEEDASQTGRPAELPTDCQQTELICPLCREWFDTRTGLSNHVRGHLKRLGKPTSTASKSPVIILKELMRDKKQFQMKLQVLEKKCRATNSFHPVRLSNGLTFASTVKRQKDEKEEKRRLEINKGSPPSDLIGILKKRRAHEEAKAKHLSHTARKAILLSSGKDCGLEIQPFKTVPNSLAEKSEHNRKVCVHCNATFHSGVSLSNHLRAYAHRKKKALLDGTTFDCKQRKQRSRSGSKKKTYPLLHTPEEIYRLTCRFCDLVFQGPLSVQEDWIKHLQRHIMNTAVPHTGAGMVEVTSVPKDSCSNTVPHAQPSVMQTSS